MAVVQRAVYRPRRARESPLYRLVEDLFDTLVGVHEERFEPQYGHLRHVARCALERFLDCGILDHGFARVVCERCKAEFLVAFSCKARILCPSCHAKKLEIWADWLEHELLYAVPHRQFVFTVPKRLRPYFLHDRRLLLTFTVRSRRPPLGVRAILGEELNDGFRFDFDHDRLMLDTKTPSDKSQGGGFGPTVQLDDGTLVTSYSYRGEDNKTHVEVVRWRAPAAE